MKTDKKIALIIIYFIVLIWSGIGPHDYFTWFLEIFPAIVGFIILALTYRRFRFTNLTYTFILLHCCILFIGGHYTYAEVPLFDWIRDAFHQSRNNYDKVGHFAQGFVPAMIVRELFVRKEVVKKGAWMVFLTICVCLSISVMYEFIEWFVAIVTGESADSFLGTQGYIWDTQSDMLYAAIGAISMVVLFSRIQNREIAKLQKSSNAQ
jgi:putative membrane protein